MKTAINFRWHDGLLILGFAFFFSIGTANAQARQQARDCTPFAQCDLNGDGFIARNEFRNGSFADFDRNGDGQISRQEYRKMNKSQKTYQGRQGQGNGKRIKAKGECDGQGPGRQKGFRQSGRQQNGSMNRGQGRSGGRGRGM